MGVHVVLMAAATVAKPAVASVLARGATRGSHVKSLLVYAMQDTRQVMVVVASDALQGQVVSPEDGAQSVKRASIVTLLLPQNAFVAQQDHSLPSKGQPIARHVVQDT